MTTLRTLFYQAKSVDNTITAKKIVELLQNKGIKRQQPFTTHIINNILADRGYDENVEKVLKEIIEKGKTPQSNA